MSEKNNVIQDMLAADLEAIYIGNLNTVDADLMLPAEGGHGSVLTWESGEDRFISSEGLVHRPLHGMGNRKVLLTVTASLQGETASRVFEVTVIQQQKTKKVVWIRPVELLVSYGEQIALPSVVIVRCEDGRQITRYVEWNAFPEDLPAQKGCEYTIEGRVEDSDLPALAHIRICGEGEQKELQAESTVSRLAEYIPASAIRLLPGTSFYDYQQRMVEYLLDQDDDSMLYSFRAACGLDTRGAEPMTGWDAAECKLRGHTTGHYMSGLALAWQASGQEHFLEKMRYMVEGLQEVQDAFAASGRVHAGFFSAYDEEQFDLLEVYTRYPEIWAPYYTLDKIMCGLYDIYRATGMEQALKLESDLGDWVYERLSRLPQAQLDRMWAMYIAGEVGAMLGTMVKLYEITKNPRHLATARLFYNEKLYYPMAENCDTLEDMHGNQHIPQAIGAADMFRVTGEEHYRKISLNFWEMVTGHHTYVNGGVGETEMFHHPDSVCRYLTEKAEESCASYNMTRLTGELFPYCLDGSLFDYYDNTLRNHIMASCSHQKDGGTTYFLPLNPGGQKEYSTTENTCCHGTGMESRFRFMEHMYAEDENFYYINLLIDSKLETEAVKLTLVTETDGRVCISLGTDCRKGLRIHIPAWAQEDYSACLGDKSLANVLVGGYLELAGPLTAGDKIEIMCPMAMRILENSSDKELVNVAYGPWVLAALHEQQDFLTAPGKLVRQGREFTDGRLRMIPLNRVDLERYHVYFKK